MSNSAILLHGSSLPTTNHEKYYAANDPLTAEYVLRDLYSKNYYTTLARNPSLPIDLLNKLIYESKGIYGFSASNLFYNSSVTLEQVLFLIKNEIGFTPDWMHKDLTVVEAFDAMVLNSQFCGGTFMPDLLCSPLVSLEDFRKRAESFQGFVEKQRVYSDSRFDVDNLKFNQYDSNLLLAVLANKNASLKTLLKLTNQFDKSLNFDDVVFENLNYPIQFSAEYHRERLTSYKWRPTYLIGLDSKVNEYLVDIMGTGPWEDLPLSWKLEMIKE